MSRMRHSVTRALWRVGALAILAFASLGTAGCARSGAEPREPLILAAYGTPQQQVLCELTARLLRDRGYTVTLKPALQSAWHVRTAMETGTVHIAWQETGAVWHTYLGHDQPMTSESSLYREVKREDDLHNIVWLTPLTWSNRQSVLLATQLAADARLASIGDLATYIDSIDPNVRLCVDERSYLDARGIAGMERTYAFRFRTDQVTLVPDDGLYEAATRDRCDALLGTALDAVVYDGAFVMLRDSRAFFSASSLAPTVHVSEASEYPELEHILGALIPVLDADALARMEQLVATGQASAGDVAGAFLEQAGLIDR